MPKIWIDLTDISTEGQEFFFTNQDFWKEPLEFFGLRALLARPLTAEVMVLPRDNGALVRGRLAGAVILPCGRCSEDFEQTVDEEFEVFEEISGEGDAAEEARVISKGGRLRLDLGMILWEQFVLIQPENPLCQENCKGLCPKCGENRNLQKCGCSEAGDDPRLVLFRNLKIS